MNICVRKLVLCFVRCQDSILTNAEILSIERLATKVKEISLKLHISFSVKKVYLKMSSAKWRPSWPHRAHKRSWSCIATTMVFMLEFAGLSIIIQTVKLWTVKQSLLACHLQCVCITCARVKFYLWTFDCAQASYLGNHHIRVAITAMR